MRPYTKPLGGKKPLFGGLEVVRCFEADLLGCGEEGL